MIDIAVTIKQHALVTTARCAGNVGENNVRQLVITDDWTEDNLIRTIVFETPGGVKLTPELITGNTHPIKAYHNDATGPLRFTIYGKVAGNEVHNASGMLTVYPALPDTGGAEPAVIVDITTECITATSAASSAASQATQAAADIAGVPAAEAARVEAESERAAFYEGFAAGLNGRVKGTDVVTGAQADGVNTIMGHQSNAISDDVSTSVILGGGTTNYNNVIGGDGTATVGLPTPNTTTPGTGANVCVVGGYDNVAGSLSSKIISDHSMTEVGGDGHAAIYGGAYNKIKNTSGFSGIFGGKENTVSDGNFIFATGYANTVKGQGSACFGNNNAINSLGGFATGAGHTIDGLYAECHGLNNKAAGNYSRADGNYSETQFVGQQSFTGGRFSQNGDAQSSTIELHRLTTDATPAVIGILNTAAPIVLKPNQAMAFSALVVAKAIGALDSAAFKVEGLAFRGATGQSYINSPIVTVLGKSAGAAAWAADAVGSSVGGLCIRGTGAAGKSIRWVVRLEVTEVVSE